MVRGHGAGGSGARRSRTGAVYRLFTQWTGPDSPGCAAGIYQKGRIVYEHGFGTADLAKKVAITPATSFELASVSKQFTAASVVLLMEQGKLKLSDSIRKYVPELPAYADPVTLDQLIHHTSGVRDYLALLTLIHGGLSDAQISKREFLELMARQRALAFPPGERQAYSNSGYVLLAVVVACGDHGEGFPGYIDKLLQLGQFVGENGLPLEPQLRTPRRFHLHGSRSHRWPTIQGDLKDIRAQMRPAPVNTTADVYTKPSPRASAKRARSSIGGSESAGRQRNPEPFALA